MNAKKALVKLFADAAQDKSTRPSVRIIDGYWTLVIEGKDKWRNIVEAACVPAAAEQTIDGETLTVRWPSVADEFFGANGRMAQALPDSEYSAPQLHIARLLQRYFEMREPALIEDWAGKPGTPGEPEPTEDELAAFGV